jgi:hypothetical protein
LIFGFFLIIFCSCNGILNGPTAIPPSAQITNIYDITDSSAQVDVQVTKLSNAENGAFGLSVTSNVGSNQNFGIATLPTIGNYSIKISNLTNNTIYSLQIYFEGTFGGGTTYEEDFNIGAPKSFTTK